MSPTSTDLSTLEELFTEADRIGSKYQDDLSAPTLRELFSVAEGIEPMTPTTAIEIEAAVDGLMTAICGINVLVGVATEIQSRSIPADEELAGWGFAGRGTPTQHAPKGFSRRLSID